MTLIIGMAKADGIYMSVDYRVTNSVTGGLIDDDAVKFLDVTYPPEDGPRALFAFTGIARLRDGTPVGDWMRETLRGITEDFQTNMLHLRDRLDRDIAKYRSPLIINVLVAWGERRAFGALTNVKADMKTVAPSFAIQIQELTEPIAFFNGSGWHAAFAGGHMASLERQLNILPRNPWSHMKLLATVNRRVAEADPTGPVSPFCNVAFVGTGPKYSQMTTSRAFCRPGESVTFRMPLILYGIDASFPAEQLWQSMQEERDPSPASSEDHNRHLQRRP